MAYFSLGLLSPQTSLDLNSQARAFPQKKKKSQSRAQILSFKGYYWLISFQTEYTEH
jgi:hypothetical protein